MSDQSPSAIETRNLRKEFRETVAVRDLDLDVQSGEIYAFLGPNGAGKTTTIKMITGLLEPTSGSVRIMGKSLDDQAMDVRNHLSYVPDQPFLYDKLSGREFLHFTARLHDIDPEERDRIILEFSEMFQMGAYLDDLGETYSHGMKQRVVLSAVFMQDPDVILVDEPLAGLDPESSHLVRRIFRQKARNGKCIFMSTHVLSVAEAVADRIGVISKGQKIEEGTFEELRDRRGEEHQTLEELFLELTQTKSTSSNE